MKFNALSMPLADAQYLETRKFQVNDIARIFRIPPHMIGDLERATFSNIEQQSIGFVQHTILPWITRWEQELNRKLFAHSTVLKGRYFVRFNLAGLLRGDLNSRYRAYAIGRQWGWLSANDVRELEDLNPIEEAEAYTRLAKEFGLRQEDIAKRVGRNRATVANTMRLLDLCDPVRSLLAQGLLSTGHAKALLGLRDPELQKMVADMTVRSGFTVRQTEQQVQKELAGSAQPAPQAKPTGKSTTTSSTHLSSHLNRIQSNLRQHFATQVTVQHSPKKGKIEIEYYGDDDLGRILELLGVPAE
jgi:hypothetical protein